MQVSMISPTDQPIGTKRLLDELSTALADVSYSDLKIIVAYAKEAPFIKLKTEFSSMRSRGGTIRGVFGIDQKGTSEEALQRALIDFDEVFVTQNKGITFHPKIYLFTGSTKARAFIGSHNFTVGGTELNFESSIRLDLDLPADNAILSELTMAWNDLLPTNCGASLSLDLSTLASLKTQNLVVDEATMRRNGKSGFHSGSAGSGSVAGMFSTGISVKPPRPYKVASKSTGKAASTPSPFKQSLASSQRLVIQISPQANGEIFLSKTAVNQNPAFFGYPFSGATVPKKPTNPSYPQRVPDPVVNIVVMGAGAMPNLTLSGYSLNTIYYTKKSEIRVTASPLVGVVPDGSVMVMELAGGGVDYDITIFRPDNKNYSSWLSACNQTMPSGGKSVPRKFGWF